MYEPSALDLRRVPPLTLRRESSASSLVIIGWEETLGGSYSVYVGDLDILFRDHRYTHVAAEPCRFLRPPARLPKPAGNAYFLVTRWDGDIESSYGRDSFRTERPPAAVRCP